jgi:predicted aspartyl protease
MLASRPSSEAALAKEHGSVDGLGRPVVRLAVKDRDDLLAVLDTGFNRSLLVTAEQARALGFVITKVSTMVQLGAEQRAEVARGTASVTWLGQVREIDILVSMETNAGDKKRARVDPDEAHALLGTELLKGSLLMIDFDTGSVEVETQ